LIRSGLNQSQVWTWVIQTMSNIQQLSAVGRNLLTTLSNNENKDLNRALKGNVFLDTPSTADELLQFL